MKVKIDSLVRAGEIKKLEGDGNIVDYEVIEFTRDDITNKTDMAVRYYDHLKRLLQQKVDQYSSLGMNSDGEINKKLSILVDIEEIVYTIAWFNELSWQDIWTSGKVATMASFKRYARVGEPNISGCVKEYLTFGATDDLCFIETALFDELKKFSKNPNFYIKFQDKRAQKKKRLGSYKAGNILKSVEYVNCDKQDFQQ